MLKNVIGWAVMSVQVCAMEPQLRLTDALHLIADQGGSYKAANYAWIALTDMVVDLPKQN